MLKLCMLPACPVVVVVLLLPPVLLSCQVVTASVDLDEVVSFRASISSLREQASTTVQPALVAVDFKLCRATGLVDPPRPVRVRGGRWQHSWLCRVHCADVVR